VMLDLSLDDDLKTRFCRYCGRAWGGVGASEQTGARPGKTPGDAVVTALGRVQIPCEI
jgi:hypothetical protein